jgi:hypothetical protein
VHSDAYGTEASVAMLVPLMLETFIASDPGFRKARKSSQPILRSS